MNQLAEKLEPIPAKVVHKRIRLRPQSIEEAIQISKEYKLSPVAAKVLAARGFKADTDLKHFLTPTLRDGLPDRTKLLGMRQACELIAQVADKKGKIAICCDFDVDGLSGGAQVLHSLRSIGIETEVFVPDRFNEGYGLNCEMVKRIAEAGFALMVCIDFGTTNIKELTLAHELGLKTIVIDHHHVSAAPPADVFVNPQQKGCGFAGGTLCASGLSWYLVVGLRETLKQAANLDVKSYLDLACLGTICDMVPLVGANRVIAKRGLELMSQTKRVGLQALKNVAGINGAVTCYHVGFGIGPRINAAGRMVHGELVIDLLTTDDADKAHKLAKRLDKLNADRKEMEDRIKQRAIRQAEARAAFQAGIVVWDKEFHTGVIGLVAQRLVEDFFRPSAVMGVDQDGIFKGSVRGVPGFNVVEALGSLSEYLVKFGGHEGAGGFAVKPERVEDFAKAFVAECEKRLVTKEREPYITADTEIELADMSYALVEELKGFAPFGVGNSSPQLLVKDLKVADVKSLKGAHLKATLTDGKRYLSGLMWRIKGHPALTVGARVNMVFKPEINSYNGYSDVQANIQAVERA